MVNSAIERLLTLRVTDIMNKQVVTISSSASMEEAADLLQKNDITGAPVVDESNVCVGVLSASDFAHLPALKVSPAAPAEAARTAVGTQESPLTGKVADYMSPLVQTVPSDASVLNAGRILCNEHIHRLIIVDSNQHPVGVVSSLDLVAAMIAAVEE